MGHYVAPEVGGGWVAVQEDYWGACAGFYVGHAGVLDGYEFLLEETWGWWMGLGVGGD